MPTIDSLTNDVLAALGSLTADAADRGRALALLNERLFRQTLTCRAVFAVHNDRSVKGAGAVTLALFGPESVVDNPTSIGTTRTGALFDFLVGVTAKGLVMRRVQGVPFKAKLPWTLAGAEFTYGVRFTTTLVGA